MATRRSTRLANAIFKPQENMIFSPSVMTQITEEYVQLFKKDNDLKIIPLLTTCHLVSRMIVSQLYRDVSLGSVKQLQSFLQNSSLQGVCAIKEFQIDCEASYSSTIKAIVQDFGKRLKMFMKENVGTAKKVNGDSGTQVFRPAADKAILLEDLGIGVLLASLLNPGHIDVFWYGQRTLSDFKKGKFERVKELTFRIDLWTIDDWIEEEDRISKVVNSIPNLEQLHLVFTDVIQWLHDPWEAAILSVATATTIESVSLELAQFPHIFCFPDTQEEVMDSTGVLNLKRGCPIGGSCQRDDQCGDYERRVRDTLRPQAASSSTS